MDIYSKVCVIIKIVSISLLLSVIPYNYSYSSTLQFETGEETPVETPTEPSLHAMSAVLMDAGSGRILYAKEGDTPMAMASTTKIMTCIIALEYGKPDDIVTVSANASSQPKVKLYMSEGDRYRLGDLLYSLMLQSHNDTAVAIAEHVGGSVEGFAALMNNKAKELGCMQTNFVTPNGLDANGHQTTAAELGMISRYAIENEEFVAITNTRSYSFTSIDGSRSFTVSNTDRFLSQMEGAFGIKTGFTGKAGYCFVGALKQDDKTFISVVLGSGWPPYKTWKWADTQVLMRYGLHYFENRNLFTKGKELDAVSVIDGQEESVKLYYILPVETVLLRFDETVTMEYEIPETLQAPVVMNQVVGVVKCYINGALFKEVPIYAESGVRKIDLQYCFETILEKYLP